MLTGASSALAWGEEIGFRKLNEIFAPADRRKTDISNRKDGFLWQ
jgi:hypothetical protein